MALSEVCQNVIEHAGTSGWVAVHAYNWRKRLGRRVVVIAVSDGGIGFRASLEPTEGRKHGDRWGDAAALEAALVHNVSRFRDKGRGQGLAGIKKMVNDFRGKISIRSGTARLSILPQWDDDVPLAEGLPFFPGAQVQIVIPSQEAGT
jgi:anti-sigma regulatory factor (Ser/Thr protein kinase)